MLIYFSLIELTENKPNPYSGIDGILSECLNIVASNYPYSSPPADFTAEVVSIVNAYFYNDYSGETNAIYPKDLISIIIQKALGDVQDFDVFINSLSLSPAAISYIYQITKFTENIYQYLGSIPCTTKPAVLFNGNNSSAYEYVILKAQCMMNNLMNNTGMTFEEKTLPLVGMQALFSSLNYWKNVYQASPSPLPLPNWSYIINAIYTSLTDPLKPINYNAFLTWLDWTKGIILNEVQGAIAGAVTAGNDNPKFDYVVIGAAAAGAFCSAQNMVSQLSKLGSALS